MIIIIIFDNNNNQKEQIDYKYYIFSLKGKDYTRHTIAY